MSRKEKQFWESLWCGLSAVTGRHGSRRWERMSHPTEQQGNWLECAGVAPHQKQESNCFQVIEAKDTRETSAHHVLTESRHANHNIQGALQERKQKDWEEPESEDQMLWDPISSVASEATPIMSHRHDCLIRPEQELQIGWSGWGEIRRCQPTLHKGGQTARGCWVEQNVFSRGKHANWLSNTKWSALKTHKWHYEDWAGYTCVYIYAHNK